MNKYTEIVDRLDAIDLTSFIDKAVPGDKEKCLLALAFKAAVEKQLGDNKNELSKVEVDAKTIKFTFTDGTVEASKIGADLCRLIKEYDKTGRWDANGEFPNGGLTLFKNYPTGDTCDYSR